ncbi:acyl-CoA:6-aminopenicillanic-acid- acyltransferase, putative [Trichophyton benhamiae CBS 112371]|uniref:Acyl-CoA:6-aminopenicillanic-acid-acyltransferase, putative n=1 Tax=Arthroderma benhamiae (strain ATCC MYA-4681 / CBS 112371) TaxID=663331 RepID=D4B507_ARTBC|nr:acyl-CoA:6-aminopenicillanic-acid- acyltransferase, putative [Trichophyton benhamiae CBS 112371]EFE29555.1 acyl-CoA:6-aminopenicillanic-acid- acyltransferase, putative [Trichophyton benhamiae CBS 112371]
MRTVVCHGSPYDASKEIHGSLDFYKTLLKQKSSMSWAEVCRTALKFQPLLETTFPNYMQEIRGIAQGAGVDVKSVLALNVRTEIAYGMFDDGCTAFSWRNPSASFLAQNWDWEDDQAPNLISLHIAPLDTSKPTIHMVTEAGIIGKVGLNSKGVGVTLNAIKAEGVDFTRLPCHLALRLALESSSRVDAIGKLGKVGVASACHITIADYTGGTGLECSSMDIAWLNMGDFMESRPDIITHTNHFVHNHKNGLKSVMFMPDSEARLARLRELLAQSGPKPEFERIEEILKDEKGYPTSICRQAKGENTTSTLFSIIMNLRQLKATVIVGRPVDPQGVLELKP